MKAQHTKVIQALTCLLKEKLQQKKNIFEKNKESVVYKKILENFPDAEMTEVKIKKGEKNE